MRRRNLLVGLTGLVSIWSGVSAFAAARRKAWTAAGDVAWPSSAAWTELAHAVSGRLHTIEPASDSRDKALLSNPFYLADEPGLTQSAGWLDAWTSTPSTYRATWRWTAQRRRCRIY